jgi:hypothetical protein
VSDATLFILVFGALLVLRIVLATIFFALLLPSDGRCPHCDAPTLRLESALFDRWLRWFRRSWCITCGWTGVLRRGAVDRPAAIEVAAKR